MKKVTNRISAVNIKVFSHLPMEIWFVNVEFYQLIFNWYW